MRTNTAWNIVRAVRRMGWRERVRFARDDFELAPLQVNGTPVTVWDAAAKLRDYGNEHWTHR